jgi:hypothetical protein
MTAAVSATAARKQSMSFNLSKYRGHASVESRAKCHKSSNLPSESTFRPSLSPQRCLNAVRLHRSNNFLRRDFSVELAEKYDYSRPGEPKV